MNTTIEPISLFLPNFFKSLPDRLQHAQPRKATAVISLGLGNVAYVLGGSSDRPLAPNPYVVFCSFMEGSPSPGEEATLDRMCSSMLAELRQFENVEPRAICRISHVRNGGRLGIVAAAFLLLTSAGASLCRSTCHRNGCGQSGGAPGIPRDGRRAEEMLEHDAAQA